MTESAVDRALTVKFVLDQERELLDWADQRLTHDGHDAELDAPGLTGAQRAAAAAVAGSDDLVLVVGPAGTGKTTALRPAVEHLRHEGRAVFGVAPSATAAQVLGEETGVDADTIHKLLIEHNLGRPPDHRYNLPRGATVIVDEAGMLGTDNLADLAQLADEKGWRVAMIGDPLQFSAVDRGGLFGLLVDTYGAVELDQVHRFVEPWERDASLRLRRGDTTVVDLYEQHGRIHCGTPRQMQTQIVNDWWTHRQHGRDVLLLAGTIDDVESLNHRCQKLRLDADELDTRRHLDTGTYRLHPGDEIVTRHNDRKLCTDRGEMVRNGNQWTIAAIHPDDTLTATGDAGTVRLPAIYIADHVQLGYARTIIAGQGRTVEPCLVYNEGPLSLRALYVAMSRGWRENHVYYGTTGPDAGADLFVQSTLIDRIDAPTHVRRAELNGQELHHPGLLDGSHVGGLLEERHGLTSILESADWIVRSYPADRQRATAALTTARGGLADRQRHKAAAEAVIERYDRPLYRRRHEDEIDNARRTVKDSNRGIRWAEGELGKAERTLAKLDESRAHAGATLAQRPAADKRIRQLDDTINRDHRARARAIRLHTPDHILDTIGPRPLGEEAAERWDQAAGRIAQHDTAYGPAAPGSASRVVEAAHYTDMSDAVAAVASRPAKHPRPARTVDIDMGVSL